MWIARNKNGELYLFTFVKPVRCDEDGCWIKDEYHGNLGGSIRLDDNLFPELTWNDEPVEVSLFPISSDKDEELPTTIFITSDRLYKCKQIQFSIFISCYPHNHQSLFGPSSGCQCVIQRSHSSKEFQYHVFLIELNQAKS